jgi:hypothetical protein
MVTRRGALATLGLSAIAIVSPRVALATVSRALSVRELTESSSSAVLGEAVEAYSQWETVGDRRRIVTFTRVLVAEGVFGQPDAELLVQTLGGRVGDIGQIVHGEAALRLGERSVLFLNQSPEGLTRVNAMAQGHYPVLAEGQDTARLRLSPRLGTLLPAQDAAVERLKGRTYPEARDIILKARQ